MPGRSRSWILGFFCCANALVSFNISSLTAAVPQMSRSLNAPPVDVGNIIGYYMIPYGLFALVMVPLASRVSIKTIMIVSVLVYSLANAAASMYPSLPLILWSRVAAGVAASAVVPLALITLGQMFDKDVRGRVLGLFFSSSFFGTMLGLVTNMMLSWEWQFIIPAVAGCVLGLLFIFCPREGMGPNTGMTINYADAFKIRGLRRILGLIFVMSLLFHGVCKWYGVYLDHIYAYDQQLISILLIVSAVVAVAGQNIGGYMTDKLGRTTACLIGCGILGVAVMLLFGHYPVIGIAAVLSAVAIGWTVAHNAISTALTDFSAVHRAELAALNSSVRFVSGGLGFWLSGQFVQNHFGLTFFIIGLLMVGLCGVVPKVISPKDPSL